jgi:hypothetical protein
VTFTDVPLWPPERWRDPHDYDTVEKFRAHLTPLARASDPQTSHQAAASVRDGAVKAIRAAFTLRDWHDDALCDYLVTLHGPTVKSARSRLTKAGLLKDSGKRAMSHRGHEQIIWTLNA